MLRFYADLSEAQAASVMGITRSAARSHTARAMAALHAELAKHATAPAESPHRAPTHSHGTYRRGGLPDEAAEQ